MKFAEMAHNLASYLKNKSNAFDGVKEIKRWGNTFLSEIRTNLKPEPGTQGLKVIKTSIQNLWKSGNSGKFSILFSFFLCFIGFKWFSEPKKNTNSLSYAEIVLGNSSSARSVVAELTKKQWMKKLHVFLIKEGGGGVGDIFAYNQISALMGRSSVEITEERLVKLMGEPSRTSAIGNKIYWYYKCSDGSIQIVADRDQYQYLKIITGEINEY